MKSDTNAKLRPLRKVTKVRKFGVVWGGLVWFSVVQLVLWCGVGGGVVWEVVWSNVVGSGVVWCGRVW